MEPRRGQNGGERANMSHMSAADAENQSRRPSDAWVLDAIADLETGPSLAAGPSAPASSNSSSGGAHAAAPGAVNGASGATSANGSKPRAAEHDTEEEDLQRYVTTRMARLTRDPQYTTVHRRLAGRRRTRSLESEILLTIDIIVSMVLYYMLSRAIIPLPTTFPIVGVLHRHVETHLAPGIVILVTWPILLTAFRLYPTAWSRSFFAPLRAILAVLATGLIVGGVYYVLQLGEVHIVYLTFVIADALVLAFLRIILRPIFVALIPKRRVLIVGTARLAIDTARAVAARRGQGLELVGVAGPRRELDVEPDQPQTWQAALNESWVNWRLGDVGDVPEIVRKHEIDLVLIALAPRERYVGSWVISSLAHMPVQLYVVPDLVTETAKTVIESIDGMPLIGLTESAISGWNARLKRLLDLAICVPMLIVLSPLMLVIALLVRFDSPGPALFKQERVGQHTRRFQMLKFRTMYVDAEQRARDVSVKTEGGLVHKQRGDPRVTRVGAILRRTSLDELPQLLNIIRGDMSVVGPRPELPWIVERYRAWQYRRLLVPQGLTGWWQVHGRSERVMHMHTQDDIYYVRNYSLWLDVKILLLTIKTVLTGKGAF